MKKTLLILFALITVLASVFILSSCNEKTPAETTAGAVTTSTAAVTTTSDLSDLPDLPENELIISKDNVSDYVIIIPKARTQEQRGLAMDLSRGMKTIAGAEIPYFEDADKEASAHEILIGNTNRPESAQAAAMLGDKEYIITVINEKLVIYSEVKDAYDAIFFHLKNALYKDGYISIDRSYSLIQNIVTFIEAENKYEQNKSISLDFTFTHKDAVIGTIIGKKDETAVDGYRGFYLEITRNLVILYKMGTIIPEPEKDSTEEAILPDENNGKFEYARGYTDLEVGKSYKIVYDFDGEYFRFYLVNDPEGIEPWPEFEVKIKDCNGYSIFFTEKSGYGADFRNIAVSDYVSDTAGKKTYLNNVLPGFADPDIIYHDGYYYMYVTSSGYLVYKSRDLANWTLVGKALPNISWKVDKTNMWAPDVEYIDGKFYMAVSLGEAGFGIAVSDSPTGPFVCQGEEPLLKKTIDGHIFVDDDGKTYLYYTSWQDKDGNGRAYGIYGVEMNEDRITPKWETETLVITANQWWETSLGMGGIVEAPFMVKLGGEYYLIYSGSHYQANYAVGYAISSSPLGKFNKTEDSPFLYRTNDARGTGHCSIAKTPDGGYVLAYHVHNSTTTVHPRHVAIDPIRFVKLEDGSYRIETYGPTTSKRPLDLFD